MDQGSKRACRDSAMQSVEPPTHKAEASVGVIELIAACRRKRGPRVWEGRIIALIQSHYSFFHDHVEDDET
jgi:hypothetical protein